MMNSDEIEKCLETLGFEASYDESHCNRFVHSELAEPIYIKKPSQRSKSGVVKKQPMVLHPDFEGFLLDLSKSGGLVFGEKNYYHATSLKGFPKRMHTGKNEICYGVGIGFESPKYLCELILLLSNSAEFTAHDSCSDVDIQEILVTTKKRLVDSRLGQGDYRKSLISLWGKCSVLGVENLALLKASHIKPWCQSTNLERLDRFNGLLLSPSLDAAFDSGLISFEDSGGILISSKIGSDAEKLNFHSGLSLSRVHEESKKYLKWHREQWFKS